MDRSGSPLVYACENHHVSIVKLLLQYNAHPNGAGSKKAPVLYAQGKDGRMQTWTMEQPLVYACKNGQPEMVNLLTTAGARMNEYLLAGLHFQCRVA